MMKPLQPFKVSLNGMHLIEASAGTGKTYNIASLYVRFLIKTNRTVDQILVVTYTEAATKELRDRLMRRLRESVQVLRGASPGDDTFLRGLQAHVSDAGQAIERLNRAIRSFDEAAIYTIHGFCGHALREYAFESGAPFETELIGDDRDLVREVVDDYWRRWVADASDHPCRRPLLKLLLDKGYGPDKLTAELAPHIGKPYLQVRPDQPTGPDAYDPVLKQLEQLYTDMVSQWDRNKAEIRGLLNHDALSGRRYREGWVDGWIASMEEQMQAPVAPIELFDKFDRFSQSFINQSLTKAKQQKGVAPPRHAFFEQVDDYLQLVSQLQSFPAHFKAHLYHHLIDGVAERKQEARVYSYDDLLVELHRALQRPEMGLRLAAKLRRSYPVALVDEFQDTDPVQYQIFHAIYGAEDEDTALYMIGDPKQSIYSFRGADIFAYLSARDDVHDQKVFSLDHNYRSVPPLLEGINVLFSRHNNPFILDDIGFEPVKAGLTAGDCLVQGGTEVPPIEIRQLQFPGEEAPVNVGAARIRSARDTAAMIQELLADARQGEARIGEQPVQARDIAVLVRTHHEAAVVRQNLRERGINSVTHSPESVFHGEESRELYQLLKAIVEPGSESHVSAALATGIMGYSARDIYELQNDESRWAEKIGQFSEWNRAWQEHSFAYMFRLLMQRENVAAGLMAYEGGERRLTNLLHLSELLQSREQEGRDGLHTILKWLQRKRSETRQDAEEEQLRLESDENLVSVVTMHHSKGLEYPVVFCPFLWHSPQRSDKGEPLVYHDHEQRSVSYLDLRGKEDPDRDAHRYQLAREELAEGMRLAYVAITRAKYRCVISWAPARKAVHSPLGVLLMGEKEAMKSLQGALGVGDDYEYDPKVISRAIAALKHSKSVVYRQVGPAEENGRQVLLSFGDAELQEASFTRTLPLQGGYGISSFSSLTRASHEQDLLEFPLYYDEPLHQPKEGDAASGDTIFDFPRGPDPGTAIHHIFENIDFNDAGTWKQVIDHQLQLQDIDPRWTPVILEMLETTLEKPLLADTENMSLAAAAGDTMIPEMEFYFTTGASRLEELLSIIRPGYTGGELSYGFAEEGYLKGFIDLTFGHDGRYYILDYKTNYLGNTTGDYAQDRLGEEMREALYDLQYHLYLVALHRFLHSQLPGYRYEEHMGGALYLFLRGINREGREGIYFDCPEPEVIEQLNEYLRRNS